MYVPLSFLTPPLTPQLLSAVSRLVGLCPAFSRKCSEESCFSDMAASHLLIVSVYCCPYSGIDDSAMLLCMS